MKSEADVDHKPMADEIKTDDAHATPELSGSTRDLKPEGGGDCNDAISNAMLDKTDVSSRYVGNGVPSHPIDSSANMKLSSQQIDRGAEVPGVYAPPITSNNDNRGMDPTQSSSDSEDNIPLSQLKPACILLSQAKRSLMKVITTIISISLQSALALNHHPGPIAILLCFIDPITRSTMVLYLLFL